MVVDNTLSIAAARAWTGICASIVYAGCNSTAFWINRAFRSAARRCAHIIWKTTAPRNTTALLAQRIWSTRWRHTRVQNLRRRYSNGFLKRKMRLIFESSLLFHKILWFIKNMSTYEAYNKRTDLLCKVLDMNTLGYVRLLCNLRFYRIDLYMGQHTSDWCMPFQVHIHC